MKKLKGRAIQKTYNFLHKQKIHFIYYMIRERLYSAEKSELNRIFDHPFKNQAT